MAYLGRDTVVGNYRRIDNISSLFNNVTTTFNLNVSSTPITNPGIATQFLVCYNNALLEPFTAYNISSGQIVFVAPPATGAYCWIIELGSTFDVGVPSDGSVTPAKLSQAYVPINLPNDVNGTSISSSKTVLGATESTFNILCGSDGGCNEAFGYGTNRDRYVSAGPNGIVYARSGNNLIESGRYNTNAISASHNNFPGSYSSRSRKQFRNAFYNVAGNATADSVVGLILGSISASNSPAALVKLFQVPTTSSAPNLMVGTITAAAIGQSVATNVRRYHVTLGAGLAGSNLVRIEPYSLQTALSTDLNIVTGVDASDGLTYYYLDTSFSPTTPYTFIFDGYIVVNTGANSFGSVPARANVSSITDVTQRNTAGTVFPVGTTAQRPAHRNGIIRINSDTSKIEFSLSGSWISTP